MIRVFVCLLALGAVASLAQAQTNLVKPETAMKVLQAQHALDQAKTNEANLKLQATQLMNQDLAATAEAQKLFDAAMTEAYKEAGKNKEEWDCNISTTPFTFTKRSIVPAPNKTSPPAKQ